MVLILRILNDLFLRQLKKAPLTGKFYSDTNVITRNQSTYSQGGINSESIQAPSFLHIKK